MRNSLMLSLNSSLMATEQKEIFISDELLSRYARQLQVNETSKATYIANIMHFIKWAETRVINEDMLIDYRLHLINNYKANAINSYIASIKSLFTFLEGLGFPNYAKGLKSVRTTKQHKKDSLTLEQVMSVYGSLNTDNEQTARTNAIIKLLVGTGLRTIEVVNANVGSIRTIGNMKVLYIQGKGFNNSKDNESAYVVLSSLVINAIQDYLKFRPGAKDDEPLFTSNSNRNNKARLTTRTIRNIVKSVFNDNGIVSERITTHSTRHTAITLALMSGASLQEVQQLARHTNINTTMIYAHNINRLENNAESKLNDMLERGLNG